MRKKTPEMDFDYLIQNDSFIRWVKNTNEIDFAHWQNIFENDLKTQVEMIKAKIFILAINHSLNNEIDKDIEDEIWSQIKKNTKEKTKVELLRLGYLKKSSKTIIQIAAGILILFSGWLTFQLISKRIDTLEISYNASNEDLKLNSESDTFKDIILNDGSYIKLSPESEIKYSKDYGVNNRILHLKGEAYFDIAKNPDLPFILITENLVAKVTGTSFYVSNKEDDEETSISLRTGKVEVSEIGNFNMKNLESINLQERILLSPNEKAVFTKQKKGLNKILVDDPILVLPKEDFSKMSFENVSVNEAFIQLSKAYNVEIKLNNEEYENCRITVNFEDESLFEKIKIICKTINAQYSISGTEIRISGGGCH